MGSEMCIRDRLWRVILAFTIAMLVGTGLGIAMGSKKNVNIMLDGWHILLLNTPALVIIILCYVWFGLNEIAAITAVALVKNPPADLDDIKLS